MKVLIQHWGLSESGPVFTYEFTKGLVENGCDVYAVLQRNIENKEKWDKLLKADHLYYLHGRPEKKRFLSTGTRLVRDRRSIKRKFSMLYFDCVIRTFVDKYDDFISKAVKSKLIINFCHDPIPHSGVSIKDAKSTHNRINKADKIVVLTQSFVPIIEKEYKRKRSDIILIRHGLLPYRDDASLIDNKYYPDEKVKFLFFGRIDPYKGIDVLLNAYEELKKTYSNVELIIAGRGDCSEYREIIESDDTITLVNSYISDDYVDKLFTEKNIILVLPYKDATQSGVATVAYEYCVPIIASDTGGLREQLFDGKAGILVRPSDPFALAEAMQEFAENQDYYNRQVEKVKKYRVELEWSSISKNFLGQL